MTLTSEQVDKLIAIYKKLYGIELSLEQATKGGEGLIVIVQTLLVRNLGKPPDNGA